VFGRGGALVFGKEGDKYADKLYLLLKGKVSYEEVDELLWGLYEAGRDGGFDEGYYHGAWLESVGLNTWGYGQHEA